LPLQGQIFHNDDTIRINEVLITGNKHNSEPQGYKKITIDSVILENNSQSSLSEMLSGNTNIFIKSYGMGGIATPSFRGTGASHTLIDWNGININSPMLGQTDLSLIPAGLVDDIQIFYGGASMSFSSGGIGGIINLGTKPVWKKETSVSLSGSSGSFGRYSGLLKFKSGNTNFQTVTKLFFQSAENDFRYLNNALTAIPVWETRTNSQLQQKGLLQEIYYRNLNSSASFNIWYQSANRNLPATMLTQQPNSAEKQFDESLRTILNYDVLHGKTDFFLTGALLFSRLNYSNKLVSIDSRNISETAVMKAGFKRPLADNIELKVFLNEELNVIKSNNYLKNTTRNTLALTASADNKGNGRIGTHILVREILDKNRFLIPDFSEYSIIKSIF
jgi:vitamin B12 transporter